MSRPHCTCDLPEIWVRSPAGKKGYMISSHGRMRGIRGAILVLQSRGGMPYITLSVATGGTRAYSLRALVARAFRKPRRSFSSRVRDGDPLHLCSGNVTWDRAPWQKRPKLRGNPNSPSNLKRWEWYRKVHERTGIQLRETRRRDGRAPTICEGSTDPPRA